MNDVMTSVPSSRAVMHEVIPGILEKEWAAVEKKIAIAKTFTDTIHIDIIDGKLASNNTWIDPAPFKAFSKDIFFELHMMVEEPIQYVKSFADAGFRRFLGHVEKMEDPVAFIAEAQMYGEVGLAIDGPTQLDTLTLPFDDLDCILLMTIKAGLSGQSFVEDYLKKVRVIRQKTQLPIEVDGGINLQTIQQAKNAGATRFAITSAIFTNSDEAAAYHTLCDQVIKKLP